MHRPKTAGTARRVPPMGTPAPGSPIASPGMPTGGVRARGHLRPHGGVAPSTSTSIHAVDISTARTPSSSTVGAESTLGAASVPGAGGSVMRPLSAPAARSRRLAAGGSPLRRHGNDTPSGTLPTDVVPIRAAPRWRDRVAVLGPGGWSRGDLRPVLVRGASGSTARGKLVYFVRHAESSDCIAGAEAGRQHEKQPVGARGGSFGKISSRWDCEALRDSRLTGRGLAQAAELRAQSNGWDPQPEAVVSSPLPRALDTATVVFHGARCGDVPFLAVEEARAPCRNLADELQRPNESLRFSYPHFDFTRVLPDTEQWRLNLSDRGESYETEPMIGSRMNELHAWLCGRPEHCIAVVSHLETIQAYLKSVHKPVPSAIPHATRTALDVRAPIQTFIGHWQHPRRGAVYKVVEATDVPKTRRPELRPASAGPSRRRRAHPYQKNMPQAVLNSDVRGEKVPRWLRAAAKELVAKDSEYQANGVAASVDADTTAADTRAVATTTVEMPQEVLRRKEPELSASKFTAPASRHASLTTPHRSFQQLEEARDGSAWDDLTVASHSTSISQPKLLELGLDNKADPVLDHNEVGSVYPGDDATVATGVELESLRYKVARGHGDSAHAKPRAVRSGVVVLHGDRNHPLGQYSSELRGEAGRGVLVESVVLHGPGPAPYAVLYILQYVERLETAMLLRLQMTAVDHSPSWPNSEKGVGRVLTPTVAAGNLLMPRRLSDASNLSATYGEVCEILEAEVVTLQPAGSGFAGMSLMGEVHERTLIGAWQHPSGLIYKIRFNESDDSYSCERLGKFRDRMPAGMFHQRQVRNPRGCLVFSSPADDALVCFHYDTRQTAACFAFLSNASGRESMSNCELLRPVDVNGDGSASKRSMAAGIAR